MTHSPVVKVAVAALLGATAYGLVRWLATPAAHGWSGMVLPFAVAGAVFLAVAWLWRHSP